MPVFNTHCGNFVISVIGSRNIFANCKWHLPQTGNWLIDLVLVDIDSYPVAGSTQTQ